MLDGEFISKHVLTSDHSMDRRLLTCLFTGLSRGEPCLAPTGRPGEAPVQEAQLTNLTLFSG